MTYRKKILISLIVIGCLACLWTWDIRNGRNDKRIISQQDLTKIQGRLIIQPTIETAAEGGPEIRIKLLEFPDFEFNIAGIKYDATQTHDLVKEVKIGDTIQLSILKYDWDTKIKKNKALRISEELINYRFIDPYEVSFKEKKYMTLESANSEWQDNDHLKWIVYFITAAVIIPLILVVTGHIKLKEDIHVKEL